MLLLLAVAISLLTTVNSPAAFAGGQHAAVMPTAYQQGDLVLRRGNGIISDIARQFSATDKRFSHVGIIVDLHGRAHVAHAIQENARGFDGVVIETLHDFLSQASDWAVYRLRLSPRQQQQMASTALSYAQRHIPFDTGFDLADSTRMYCTEFVWRVSGEVSQPNPIITMQAAHSGHFISIENIYRQKNAFLIEAMPARLSRD